MNVQTMSAPSLPPPRPTMVAQLEAMAAARAAMRVSAPDGRKEQASPAVMAARELRLLAALATSKPLTVKGLVIAIFGDVLTEDEELRVRQWMRRAIEWCNSNGTVRLARKANKVRGDRGYLYAITPAGRALLARNPPLNGNPFELGFIPEPTESLTQGA